jgi:hypothetical protein
MMIIAELYHLLHHLHYYRMEEVGADVKQRNDGNIRKRVEKEDAKQNGDLEGNHGFPSNSKLGLVFNLIQHLTQPWWGVRGAEATQRSWSPPAPLKIDIVLKLLNEITTIYGSRDGSI